MKISLVLPLIAFAIFGAGCTHLVISEKNPKPGPVQLVATNYYLTWEGLPYYLPKSRIRVDGAWNKESREWDIKVTPVIEPDTNSVFRLSRNENHGFDDDITVAIDANGLLQTVDATTEDKTVSAIADLIAAAANAFSFGAGLSPGVKAMVQETKTKYPSHYPLIVFPASSFHLVFEASSGSTQTSHWVSAPLGNGLPLPMQSNQYTFVMLRPA